MKHSRTFKCYLCREQFGSTRKMNVHFKIDLEGLDCLECSKDFNSPLSLKKHSYVHKLCNFNCTRCEKTFPFKSQRDFHKKVHDKLQFSCTRESCGSPFTRESDLRHHVKLHNSDPIKCKHCDYTNTDIRNVRQIMRKHTGEKPYKCTRCGKDFKYSMQMKHHKCENIVLSKKK